MQHSVSFVVDRCHYKMRLASQSWPPPPHRARGACTRDRNAIRAEARTADEAKVRTRLVRLSSAAISSKTSEPSSQQFALHGQLESLFNMSHSRSDVSERAAVPENASAALATGSFQS